MESGSSNQLTSLIALQFKHRDSDDGASSVAQLGRTARTETTHSIKKRER